MHIHSEALCAPPADNHVSGSLPEAPECELPQGCIQLLQQECEVCLEAERPCR